MIKIKEELESLLVWCEKELDYYRESIKGFYPNGSDDYECGKIDILEDIVKELNDILK